MVVTVKLFATFQEGRFDAASREYPAGTRLSDVVDELRLPREAIGVLLVNSRHAELERELAPGDVVAIFPQIGGG
jgi:molybdopterin synthase sulfur carrier subunit